MLKSCILTLKTNQTALEIARSLVVGYIEEEEDLEDEEGDTDASSWEREGRSRSSDARNSTDIDSSGGGSRSSGRYFRGRSNSGSDSAGSDNMSRLPAWATAGTGDGKSYKISRAAIGREQSLRYGRLASFGGHDKGSDSAGERGAERRRAFSASACKSSGGSKSFGGGGVVAKRSLSDSQSGDGGGSGSGTDGGTSGNERRFSFGARGVVKRQNSVVVGRAAVGAAVKLSAEAEAIMNADSSPPSAPPDADAATVTNAGEGKGNDAESAPRMLRSESAPVELSISTSDVVARSRAKTGEAPKSSVGDSQKGDQQGPLRRAMSFSAPKPVELEAPISGQKDALATGAGVRKEKREERKRAVSAYPLYRSCCGYSSSWSSLPYRLFVFNFKGGSRGGSRS